MNCLFGLHLFHQALITLWGDEIFGRHALLSRGWGNLDKRAYRIANDPVEVRLLLLQPLVDFCSLYCGVMKSLADMPSRLGGGDYRINEK